MQLLVLEIALLGAVITPQILKQASDGHAA